MSCMPIGGLLPIPAIPTTARASQQRACPSDVEVAAAYARCGTKSRSYAHGVGIVAEGTVCESMLPQDSEQVARVGRKLDTGVLSIVPLNVEGPAQGDL